MGKKKEDSQWQHHHPRPGENNGSVLNFCLENIPGRGQEKKAREILTVRSAVSEERDQKRHVINVLQMRPNLMDTTR